MKSEVSIEEHMSCLSGICVISKHCSEVEHVFSNLTFTFEDQSFILPPKAYLLDGNDFISKHIKDSLPEEYIPLIGDLFDGCIIPIIATPSIMTGQDYFLIGDVFIRNFYTVFDWETTQVRFAINANAVSTGVQIKHADRIPWFITGGGYWLIMLPILVVTIFFQWVLFKR